MKNLIGNRYKRLTVIKEVDSKRYKSNIGGCDIIHRRFLCRCDCSRCVIKTYNSLVRKTKDKACRKCLPRKRSKKYVKKVNLGIHKLCGEPIDNHRRCKKCTCLMCKKSLWKEYENTGICTECIDK